MFYYFELSLIKMLYWVVYKNCRANDDAENYLTVSQLIQAVRRNFGGSDEFDPLCEFHDCLQSDTLMQVRVVVMCCNSYLNMLFVLMLSNINMHYSTRHLLQSSCPTCYMQS